MPDIGGHLEDRAIPIAAWIGGPQCLRSRPFSLAPRCRDKRLSNPRADHRGETNHQNARIV